MYFKVYAQNNKIHEISDINQSFSNEIKANAFQEVSYERLLQKNISVGVFVMKNYLVNLNMNFMVAPYFRKYFGKGNHGGFFIDAHGGLVNKYVYIKNVEYEEHTIKGNYFGYGLSIGNKFILSEHFTSELFLGFGSQIDDSRKGELLYGFDLVYPRLGIGLGYRF